MPLPVYILSCPTGAALPQILSQLVRGTAPGRVSAIVPGRRRKKTPDRTRDGVALIYTRERMVRMGEGCACCTVRGDILQKVRAVVQTGEADQLIIQLPPAADLGVLAKTFTVPDLDGAVLADTANPHTLIVVVTLADLGRGRQTAQLLQVFERIELAEVVLLDASGSHGPSELAAAKQVVHAINPHALCVDLASEAATLNQLSGHPPFDLDEELTEPERFTSGLHPFQSKELHA